MKWDLQIEGKLIRFKTDDGILLHGFLVSVNSEKIIIHIHGMGSNFYELPVSVEKIIKYGCSFLAVNNRGHDTVTDITTTKLKWVKGGTAFEKFEDSFYDIKAAIDFASKNGFSDIILSGHSTGCQKITYYQSKARDKRVKGVVLLAPADDYNYVSKKELRGKLGKVVEIAKKSDKNDLIPPKMLKGSLFGADRFLSVVDPKRIEAQIFNYDSNMKNFSKIKCPVLAVFGSKEQYATKPVKEHLEILKRHTSSPNFTSDIIKDADHNFTKKEKELAEKIGEWLVGL